MFEPAAALTSRPTLSADPEPDWDDEDVVPIGSTKLSMLRLGQQFLYVFDLGDGWMHLCTVAEKLIDLTE